MDSVSAVREAVLASNGPKELIILSMRVMLATGVSLREPQPELDRDAKSVQKVRNALREMGVKV